MEVIILGSGTFIPIPERSSPCILIKTQRSIILLDIGPGSVRQIAKTGLSCAMINYVFLSHFHPDHTADIIHLFFTIKNIDEIFKRPLIISGPIGTKRFINDLQQAYLGHIDLSPNMLKIDELGKKSRREYTDFSLISQPMKHSKESIGFRIEDNLGKSLVYSGDTGICDEIIDLAKMADILILECSLPEEYINAHNIETHLSPSDAGKIASKAKVKLLVLTHIYPECLKIDIINRCKKYYKGNIIIAKDLLKLNI